MVGEQRALLLQEVEQVRHLLEVRGNVRRVTREVYVVELHEDHVLHIASQPAAGRGRSVAGLVGKPWGGYQPGDEDGDDEQDEPTHGQTSPLEQWPAVTSHA